MQEEYWEGEEHKVELESEGSPALPLSPNGLILTITAMGPPTPIGI